VKVLTVSCGAASSRVSFQNPEESSSELEGVVPGIYVSHSFLSSDSPAWGLAQWELPSVTLDPFSLPRADVGKYTSRRKNDMLSFKFHDGELMTASVRDLFLRLVRVGGTTSLLLL
jgi:hypothetical protein